MRSLLKAFICAMALNLSAGSALGADGMSAPEFKKIVMGNTLLREASNGDKFMFYFIDDKKLLFSSEQSAPTTTQDWSFTEDGRFCYVHTYQTIREFCWGMIRFDGKTLFSKNVRGREQEFTLMKGKHTLKVDCAPLTGEKI